MDEPLIYSASLAEKKDDVINRIKELFIDNKEAATAIVKEIFFAPDTDKEIRRALADLIGKTKSIHLFNMVLSHFILKDFDDLVFLIKALGSFANPKAIRALVDCYKENNSSWEIREAVINALSNIPAPETFEFFVDIFNDTIELEGEMDYNYMKKFKQKASEALSKQIV